jgi:ATP-dependent DNA helicase RecQ
VIFSDKTLHEMCRHFPKTESEMRQITGVGDAKLERYGREFMDEIRRYVESNPVSAPVPRQDFGKDDGTVRPRNGKKNATIEETYALHKNGLPILEIAARRNLALSTIAGHMEQLIGEGRHVNMDILIDADKRREIEKILASLEQWNLTNVVNAGKGAVSYDEARIVRAYLTRMKENTSPAGSSA